MAEDTLVITDVPDESRYEATLDGAQAGVVEYQLDGDVIMFTHTGVPPEFEGRGIASRLARYVLDDARTRGLEVLPGARTSPAGSPGTSTTWTWSRRRRDPGTSCPPTPDGRSGACRTS